MGSGGRRAAERRVGDEEMEEENNRILVVKSDEKWMKFRKEAVIASLILELMWCFLLKPPVYHFAMDIMERRKSFDFR